MAALRNFGNDVDADTLKKFVNLLKENDNPARYFFVCQLYRIVQLEHWNGDDEKSFLI